MRNIPFVIWALGWPVYLELWGISGKTDAFIAIVMLVWYLGFCYLLYEAKE